MCTFAVQAVSCGNIAGNISKLIQIASIDGLQPMENHGTHSSDVIETTHTPNAATSIAYIISISFLATALITSTMMFVTAIVYFRRSKAKINTALTSAEGVKHSEPMYEDVTGPVSSDSVVNTLDNVAYGHITTSTLKDSPN